MVKHLNGSKKKKQTQATKLKNSARLLATFPRPARSSPCHVPRHVLCACTWSWLGLLALVCGSCCGCGVACQLCLEKAQLVRVPAVSHCDPVRRCTQYYHRFGVFVNCAPSMHAFLPALATAGRAMRRLTNALLCFRYCLHGAESDRMWAKVVCLYPTMLMHANKLMFSAHTRNDAPAVVSGPTARKWLQDVRLCCGSCFEPRLQVMIVACAQNARPKHKLSQHSHVVGTAKPFSMCHESHQIWPPAAGGCAVAAISHTTTSAIPPSDSHCKSIWPGNTAPQATLWYSLVPLIRRNIVDNAVASFADSSNRP